MIRYSYTLNDETFLLEKEVRETYPEVAPTLANLEKGMRPGTVKKAYIKALEGLAQSPFIKIEEEFFQKHNDLIKLQQELVEIEEQLTSEDVVLTDEESDELAKRQAELEDSSTNVLNSDGTVGTVTTDGAITEATKALDALTEANPWLNAIISVETTAVRPEPKGSISPEEVKLFIRKDRDLEVRDYEDSIADLAKMVSLSFSTISALWSLVPEDQKALIPESKRNVIEYSVAKFAQTQTRADEQLEAEGVKLIDKLFTREVKIKDIIKRHR